MIIPDGSVKRAVRYNGKSAYYVWFISDEWRDKYDMHYVEFETKEMAMLVLVSIVDANSH